MHTLPAGYPLLLAGGIAERSDVTQALGEARSRPWPAPVSCSPRRTFNRLLAPGARYIPGALQARMIRAQRPGSRLLTPAGPTDDGPETLVDAGPLYAGETVARITEVRPTADLVRALAP